MYLTLNYLLQREFFNHNKMKRIQPIIEPTKTAILLIHCPDKQGLLAMVTEFINKNNGNILYLDQHVDREEKLFYMRVEWELANFSIPKDKIADYFETLIANNNEMTFELHFSEEKPRMAIFVSKMSHCLFDILARYTAGEWNVEIPLIISNHPDMAPVAEGFGIDYHVFPINKTNKEELEPKELALLKEYNIDFIVLARYMQIISDDFINHYPHRIINIHHSFLPAFVGAKPYHAAYERGVKIIGATSHYVTPELDAGPIIKQEVAHVSHKDTVNDLIAKGRDLEKIVLSKAVNKHIERKILVYNNRTVVFS
jgi:formyltetrahydrofolate deformylase